MEKEKKLIYLLEDSIIIAESLKRSLEATAKFELALYSDPELLLDHIQIRKPDLIITDYYLEHSLNSGVNGVFVLNKAKMINPQIPIVLLTGISGEKLEVIQKTYPFDAIIKKDVPKVLDVTEKILSFFLEI